MKRILYYISVFAFLPFVLFGVFGSKAWANSCAIQSGPISEMTEYSSRVQQEIASIISESQARNNSCQNNFSASVSWVFDSANADLIAFQHTHIDFLYNTKVAFQAKTKTQVRRDEKFFDTIEKNIENAIEPAMRSCALDNEAIKKVRAVVQEVQVMKMAFQRSALGMPLTRASHVRGDNMKVIEAMNTAYHPSAVTACESNNESEKDFLKTLKSAFNIGGKMEDALSTWRKALALLRGGGHGMTASEVVARERQLLQAELSRQGLSQNAKDVILRNFDCYKAKVAETGGNPENLMTARMECLQIPLTGVDKIYNMWNNFTWSAKTTDEISRRMEIEGRHKVRSVNIEEMHDTLKALTMFEQENNDNTQKGLIDLHINLQLTNTLLEKRLPAAQKNCMKGQPDIEGGCR